MIFQKTYRRERPSGRSAIYTGRSEAPSLLSLPRFLPPSKKLHNFYVNKKIAYIHPKWNDMRTCVFLQKLAETKNTTPTLEKSIRISLKL